MLKIYNLFHLKHIYMRNKKSESKKDTIKNYFENKKVSDF